MFRMKSATTVIRTTQIILRIDEPFTVEILGKRDFRGGGEESLVEESDRSGFVEIQVDSESAKELNGNSIKIMIWINSHQIRLRQPSKMMKMVFVALASGRLLAIPLAEFTRRDFGRVEITFNAGWRRIGISHQGVCVGNEIC
jgi:hypothetical protein